MLLSVRATPRASRDAITGLQAGAEGRVSLGVKVTAAPDKGQANRAVIETIAKAARLPKSAFEIVSGAADRNKTLLVKGDPAELQAVIAALGASTEES